MKHLFIAPIILSILFAACQNASEAPPSDVPPPAETEVEWVTLFDGTDLNHFNMTGEAQWNIIDDYVEADGYKQSYLVTKEAYSDFQLRVDFWPSPDANSGVYIRCENPE